MNRKLHFLFQFLIFHHRLVSPVVLIAFQSIQNEAIPNYKYRKVVNALVIWPPIYIFFTIGRGLRSKIVIIKQLSHLDLQLVSTQTLRTVLVKLPSLM